jgi:PAS domain S-box-containing protein
MRALLTSLPAAAIFLSGPDLTVQFANDTALRLIGDREVLGRPLGKALPELAGEAETLHKIMQTGEHVRGSEERIRFYRDGNPEQIFVDYVYHPIHAADNGVLGILLYATDVTEHVQERQERDEVAAQLADTENRLRGLFETMPQGVIHYAADGTVLGANPAARHILGLTEGEMSAWPLASFREAIHEDGAPFQLEELPLSRALTTGEVDSELVLGVRHARTGELRWVRATAVPDARDEAGRPQRAHVIFTDMTEQRRLERELRESHSLLGRLRDANVLGVTVVDEQQFREANAAFLSMIGYSQDDVAAGRISYQSITPPEWDGHSRNAIQQLRETGVFQPFEKEYMHRDGHRVQVLVGGAVISVDPLSWVAFVVDLSARQRAERERAEAAERERAARDEAAIAGERLEFLLRAGYLVAASREPHEMLEHAAHLVVPVLGDHCVVWLPAEDGTLRATSLVHRDPARAPVLEEFRRHRVSPVGPMSIQVAYSTGKSQLLRNAGSRLPQWDDRLTPGLVDVLARLRADSVLSVPLLVDERPAGVLALTRDADRPTFTEVDIAVVEEFARRLADGLATADELAREHLIAETLQRSFLPDTLPSHTGLDLAVCYLPATLGAQVGGDWYDAFPLGSDRVGLVIGDVAGHNINSASIMGHVRSMLRAYAINYPDPAEVLEWTNRAMVQLMPADEALATAVYAVLDTATGELIYANAGHLPPLVADSSGEVHYLDDTEGTMLGASPGLTFTAGRRRLSPGDVFLNYTDGLIENGHRDLTDGLDTLVGVLRQSAPATAEQACDVARGGLLGTDPLDDDVCLLAVRLQG